MKECGKFPKAACPINNIRGQQDAISTILHFPSFVPKCNIMVKIAS